jgi:trk system potassium uptake protein TrkH
MSIARTISLGFLTVIGLGTVLLMLPFSTTAEGWNSPLVAFFTSTSAVCVTGLIVVDTGSHFSFWGQLFIVLLIQVGGLGYMTTTTFLVLVLRRKFDLRQKFAIQESFDRPFLHGSRNLIRSILAVTLSFELLGIMGLLPSFAPEFGVGGGLWQAIFHSVSAWNNAGFSLFSDSLVGYRDVWRVNLVVSLLIIGGGIGYQVILELALWGQHFWQRLPFRFSLNTKVAVSTTMALLLLGWLGFAVIETHQGGTLAALPWQERLLSSWFQSVTTRTAGFNTVDFGQMTDAALWSAIVLMFVGASPSGTGGGIKTTTLRILLNCTRSTLRGREWVVMYGRTLSSSLILKSLAVFVGSGIAIGVSTLLLSLTDPQKFSFIDLLFEVVSAFATVGLSTGITADFSALGQLILILTMFMGRIGILVFVAAIVGEAPPSQVRYPEENLLVG